MTNQTRRADVGLGRTAKGGSGGSFAPHNRGTGGPPPAYAALNDADGQRDAIVEQIERVGYAHASTVESATNPAFTEGIDTWWQQHYERMEQQPAGHGAFKVMPDDYTPRGTSGHALSGLRRTHRMNYSGAGVNLRMPSVTAIRRFSSDNKKQTFDLPIEMEHSGGRISGYVRVTEGAGGAWDVQALGFPDHVSKNRAAESVACLLESRRPSLALKDAEVHYEKLRQAQITAHETGTLNPVAVGNSPLQQRQIDRAARSGAQMVAPSVPSFIKGAGYDRATGTLTLNMKGNRTYSYQVSRIAYEEIVHSGTPGRTYNELVKNKADRVQVDRCTKCRRVTRSGVQHTCPAVPKAPRQRRDAHRTKVQALLLMIAKRLKSA